MIDDLKAILNDELNCEIQVLQAKREDIMAATQMAEKKLWDLENEKKYGIKGKTKFSVWEKLVSKRSAYQKYKAKVARLATLPDLINEAQQEYDVCKAAAQETLRNSGIDERINAIKFKQYEIEKTSLQSVNDLGLSFDDALVLLEKHQVTPIFDQKDNVVVEQPRDYRSKESLLCVHKTRYMPTDKTIKTARDANVKYHQDLQIDGRNYQIEYASPRNTVHMTLNTEVGGHLYGSWDDCQYVVLMPFKDLPNQKIARAASMDMFTRGSVALSAEATIICPTNEIDAVKAANPGIAVVGCDQPNGMINAIVSQKGYRAENGNAWGWEDWESQQQFQALMQKEGLKMANHNDTCFAEDEDTLLKINKAVAVTKLLSEQNLVNTPADMTRITPQLATTFCDYQSLLGDLLTTSNVQDVIEPDAIKGNNRQLEVFYAKMARSGFEISPIHQVMLNKILQVHLHGQDFEQQRDLIFKDAPELHDANIGDLFEQIMCRTIINTQQKSRDLQNNAPEMTR